MTAAGSPPSPPSQRPWWAGPAGALLFRVVWPTRVHDAHLVPASGPVVLAGNHLGVLDGPLLIAASPRWPTCLVKAELFDSALGPVLRAAGQIPIVRDGLDRTALEAAVGRLRAGGVVGVFPEGTRGRGDVAQARAGAAWLAVRAGAPIVPVAVLGTRRTGESASRPPRPRRLDLVFGAPLDLTRHPDVAGLTGRSAVAAATQTLRDALAEHVRRCAVRTGQPLPDETAAAPSAPSTLTTEGGRP